MGNDVFADVFLLEHINRETFLLNMHVCVGEPRGNTNSKHRRQVIQRKGTFNSLPQRLHPAPRLWNVGEAATVVDLVAASNPLEAAIDKLKPLSLCRPFSFGGNERTPHSWSEMPREPEVSYIFAGDSSMALVDFPKEKDGYTTVFREGEG